MGPWMVMLGIVLVGILALALLTAAAMSDDDYGDPGAYVVSVAPPVAPLPVTKPAHDPYPAPPPLPATWKYPTLQALGYMPQTLRQPAVRRCMLH